MGEEVERFLLHLIERKASHSTHNVYVGALRFLYLVVLERPEVIMLVPRRKQPVRVPVLLPAVDVVRLLAAVPSITVRTILKSLDAIMRQTPHKSEQVARGYIRHAKLFDDNAAVGLA